MLGIPCFETAYMAVEKVQERLQRSTRALDAHGVPYAVIGGNAVAAWVATVDEDAVRFTKDVDVLIARRDLDRAEAALSTAGFERTEVLGVTMFLDRNDPSPKRGVHVVFSGERVKQHYDYPAPEVRRAVLSQQGFAVIDLESLVTMKLTSFRRLDQVHILDLLGLDLIPMEMDARLPSDLQDRLRQLRENPD